MKTQFVLCITGPTVGDYERTYFDCFQDAIDAAHNHSVVLKPSHIEIMSGDWHWIASTTGTYRPAHLTPV